MARPSTNVTIFSETPKPITALPTEVQTGGYQNNQVITAGEYNMMMSTIQKWVKYLDGERATGVTKDTTHDTEIASLKTRATSLEDSRKNRVGEIVTTLSATAPADCLPCNGSQVAIASYTKLFNYYKTDSGAGFPITSSFSYNLNPQNEPTWGHLFYNETETTWPIGPGSIVFLGARSLLLPNLQGMFLRMGGGNGAGPVRKYQADELKSHRHGVPAVGWHGDTGPYYANVNLPGGGQAQSQNINNTTYHGGTETRPKNIAVNFWIRYR